MTSHDHKRLLICRSVKLQMMQKYRNNASRMQRLTAELAAIDAKLAEPVTDQANSGEYLKVDNPFIH